MTPRRLPIPPARIRAIGLKAASLEYLQRAGLYTIPLLQLSTLPPFPEFARQAEAAGFRQGKDLMAVRFSPYKVAHYQPRFWGAKTFREVYRYLVASRPLFRTGSFLVVPSIRPLYMSTMYVQPGKPLYAEVVPGTWMTSAVSPSDRLTITPRAVTFSAYQRTRKVLSNFNKKRNGFIPTTAAPLAQAEMRRLAKAFWQLGVKVRKEPLPKCLLEIQLIPPLQLEVREIKTDSVVLAQSQHHGAVYELNRYQDLARWDKRQPLLVNVPADKFNADHFFKLLKALSTSTKRVFIRYGMLTHPAILIREAGIETIPYRDEYKTFTYKFSQ